MTERLYTEHPAIYDAIQAGWDYDRDVAFVEAAHERAGVGGDRLLELGCGTGEHTRRLVDAGFDVTAVDKYEGMLEVARSKCPADFRRATLPEIPVEGPFDAAVAIRGVVNHLTPDELAPTVEAVASRLVDGGPFVFDNSPLPAEGNPPGIDVGPAEGGDYARIAQQVPTGDGRLDWQSVTFTPDGEFFVNSRPMTPFEDGRVRDVLVESGYSVEAHDGFGHDDERTVFVARAGED